MSTVVAPGAPVPLPRDRVRWVRAGALPVAVAVLGMAATGALLGLADGVRLADVLHLVPVAACAVTGGLVARRRPDNPIGPLLLGSAAAFAAIEFCGRWALQLPEGSTAGQLLGWPQTWLWVPGNVLLSVTPVFFPDGRPGRRWRVPLRLLAAFAVVTAVLSALRPGTDVQLGSAGRPNALGVEGLRPLADAVAGPLVLAAGVVLLAGSADLVRRVRREPPGSRLRTQAEWLAYAVGVAALLVLVRLLGGLADDRPRDLFPVGLPWELAGVAAASLLPVGVGVAVVRHRLLDIERLISRTVVLAVLTLVVVGCYLAGVAVAAAVLDDALELPASAAAAVLAAVVLAPVRSRLQRRVDRLLYGDRGDPYAVLARLARRLEHGSGTELLASAAGTVREALQLPGVGIAVDGGEPVLAGRLPSSPVELPLVASGERVGRLLLAPRHGEDVLGRRDLRLLRDVAPGIAGAVRATRESERAARLTLDLQRSRERLVLAREEERRRLRRDFHDGLGPVLAGLAMRAETAAEVADLDAARPLLAEIADDARAALADARRLVDALRPPALDTLGLARALHAHLVGRPGPPALLDVPVPLPALPAAVEVAAYRIAAEAVTNADRHAAARTVRVRLAVEDGALLVEVTDDGRGGAVAGRGVGTSSMRERAAELGGSCTIGPGPRGGTVVCARLPLDPVGDRS